MMRSRPTSAIRHVNANGLIYGSPEESTDMVPVLDPVTTRRCARCKHPLPRSEARRPRRTCRAAPSPYWGDEAIWDGHTSIHNPMIDEKGRVWFTARIRAAAQPGLLQARLGSSVGQGRAARATRRGSSPCTIRRRSKWTLIDTCFSTQHLYFAKDANNTLWTSAGGPAGAASSAG